MTASTSTTMIQAKIEAAFICLAVTDALGGPLEFLPRRKDPAQHVTEMIPNGNFGLPPGHFTDDTSMALCLAYSLIESGGVTDYRSQAEAYVSWFRNGWMSSVHGKCFDIGNQTRHTLALWDAALQKRRKTMDEQVKAQHVPTKGIETEEEQNKQHRKDLTETKAPKVKEEQEDTTAQTMLAQIRQQFSSANKCGNGSLMRVLPTILVAKSEAQAIRLARESSDVTHPHPRCADSCTLYAILVYRCLHGASKQELFDVMHEYLSSSSTTSLSSLSSSSNNDGTNKEDGKKENQTQTQAQNETLQIDKDLQARFEQYKTIQDFHDRNPDQISSSGYVLDTLEAALWVFFTTTTYRTGAIKVVNLGDDADTVGAVYGGLAGAFYAGASSHSSTVNPDTDTDLSSSSSSLSPSAVLTFESIVPEEWLQAMKGLNVVRGIVARILKHFHPL